MKMKLLVAIVGLLFSFVTVVNCGVAIVGTQTASGTCLRLVGENKIRLNFNIALNLDPDGLVVAKNSQGVDVNSLLCSFTNINDQWQLESYVNTNTPAASTNGCGVSVGTDVNNDLTYTWRVYYYELTDRSVDFHRNRRYTITCAMSNIHDNQLTAQIIVTTPDLDQTINPIDPQAELQIWAETVLNSNIYYKVEAADQIPVGTMLKLRIVFPYMLSATDGTTPIAVAGLETKMDDVSPVSSSAIGFFDAAGCQDNDVYAPAIGFVRFNNGENNGNIFMSETGAFPATRLDTDRLVFRTTYDFCPGVLGRDGDPFCINPCANPRTRRRRQTPDERSMVVSINIVDNSRTTDQRQVEDVNTALVIGASVGGVILLLCVVVLACVAVVMCRRRRQDKKSEQKIQPAQFENKLQY